MVLARRPEQVCSDGATILADCDAGLRLLSADGGGADGGADDEEDDGNTVAQDRMRILFGQPIPKIAFEL